MVGVLWLIAATAGCGGSVEYELAPVRGTVTLDGEPLTQVKVMFAPVSKGEGSKAGKPGFGVVGPDGSFVLGTYEENDGAVVGEHWVTVIRLADKKKRTAGDSAREVKGKSLAWERVTYPERLHVASAKENEFTIVLTSEMAAKHGQQND